MPIAPHHRLLEALLDSQIKLALKLPGRPLGDEESGPLTWDVWRSKAQKQGRQ